ncbi:NAD(P)/FAD-dependent oxidoreductase [Allofournierella sp.]|uniref:NAD(P)/FAD-dependent oxidoreductase n=1 Tax=Allofournierella sp. TaxID=1940256 RepID=UPI003AF7F8EB
MEDSYDVLVIGGCTAGLYFAERMAKQGYRVLVAEKDSENVWGTRLDIFHLDMDCFERFGVPRPDADDEAFVQNFTYSVSRSALDRHPKKLHTPVSVMHLPQYVRKLRAWAERQGVKIQFETKFQELLFDGQGRIQGAVLCNNGERFAVKARLVADCSGIDAVVRTRLPESYGVETFVVEPADKYHVVLHYIKLADPERDRVTLSTSWPYYKTWAAPSTDPEGAIFGVGAGGSFETAEENYQGFLRMVSMPPHSLHHIEKGIVPAHRAPYSFVADGFVALGDAACVTKPWNGEGITAHWLQCEIAAQEFGRAMQNEAYPTAESVWQVNTRYMQQQGAYFAQRFAAQSGALDTTPEENDYEFANSIVFKGDDETTPVDMQESLKKGIQSGALSMGAVQRLMDGFMAGEKLYQHYLAFPRTMDGFDTWAKQADDLWQKVDSLRQAAR